MTEHGEPARAVATPQTPPMTLKIMPSGATIFIREDPGRIQSYPPRAETALRLPTWEAAPVALIALLVRIGQRPDLTFQMWLNATVAQHMAGLQQLARDTHVYVEIMTQRVERVYRVENPLRRKATAITQQLQSRIGWWDDDLYTQTWEQLNRLYPTPDSVWQQCVAAERGGERGPELGRLTN